MAADTRASARERSEGGTRERETTRARQRQRQRQRRDGGGGMRIVVVNTIHRPPPVDRRRPTLPLAKWRSAEEVEAEEWVRATVEEGDDEVLKATKTLNWLWLQIQLRPYDREVYKERPGELERRRPRLWELPLFAAPQRSGNNSCGAKEEEELELQPEIWQRLPSSLQEVIVARLPLCSRIRCRCVCKLWSSPAFTAGLGQGHHPPMPCLLCLNGRNGTWSLYDPTSTPPQWRLLTPPPQLLAQHPLFLRCSDRGLVCLEQQLSSSRSGGSFAVVVCNPITGRCRLLPLPPGTDSLRRPCLLQIAAAAHDASYKVVRVNADRATWVYDSTTALWDPAQRLPLDETETRRSLLLSLDETETPNAETSFRTVRCNGKIYALGARHCRLWEFDLETRVWAQTGAEMFPYWGAHSLLECGGEVFLAALDAPTALHGSFYLWRFHTKLRSWLLVTKLPDHLYPEFKYYRRAVFNVLGTKDFVMVTAAPCAASPLSDTACFLAYDLGKGTWQCLPPALSPIVNQASGADLMGVSFHPHLGAMP